MKILTEKVVQVVHQVRCDGCDASCTDNIFGSDYAELSAFWGYNSALDGTKYDIQLCENCFLDIIRMLKTKRSLWCKTEDGNPLYGELKYEQ